MTDKNNEQGKKQHINLDTENMDPDNNYADKVFHQKHLCQITNYMKAIVILYKIYSENLTLKLGKKFSQGHMTKFIPKIFSSNYDCVQVIFDIVLI